MKDYPDIWLSAPELARAIAKYHTAGIGHKFRDVFDKIQATLDNYKMQGRDISRVQITNWLNGYLYTQAIGEAVAEERLKKGKNERSR